MHPCNSWLITVLVLVRDLILLFCDEHTHDVWKSVRSNCWLWLDHTLNSFLDSKPGDAATGIVFRQTSNAWKDTVMDVLSEHRDLGLSEKSLHSQWDTLPSGAGRQRRDFLFLTKCNRFPDLIFCCFTVTVDVWGSMCSAKFPVQNNHVKLEWIYLYQKPCCFQRGEH